MHRGTILTKTGKGLKEATGKTSNLSRDLRNVLKEIDGQVSVSKLLDKFEKVTEPKLLEVLKQLETEGYVREFVAQKDDEPRTSIGRPSISQPPASVGQDLDFTSLGSAGVPSKSSYLGPPSKPSEDAKLQAQAQEIARQVQARRAYEDGAARARAEAEVLQRKVAEARARKAIEEKTRREVAERTKVGAASGADALDRARHEADERARREAEEKARLEAEVRARIEVELGVKRGSDEQAGRESAEKAQREAAERARKEAEDRARREREEQARAEHAARVAAEARARAEAEMRVRRELEERARREADERSRQEEMVRRRAEEDAAKRRQIEEDRSLERSVREHEEIARRDAEQEREEAERRKQEERARVEAEEGARREEEEKRAKEQEKRAKEQEKRAKEQDRQARDEERAQAKAETEQPQQAERSRERAGEGAWRGDEEAVRTPEAESIPARAVWAKRKPRSVARQLPVLLLVVLIVATAAVPFVSMEPGPYEKAAQTWLGQPVKIGSVSWSLFPTPQLRFEKVAIGKDPQMRVAAISATPEILSLFAERKVLRSLDLENASFPREFLPVLLMERGKGRPLGVERMTAKGLKLDVPELKLAPLDLDASFAADGALKTVTFLNAERKLSVTLQPQRGRTAIEISSGSFPLPIGPDLVLSDFVAKGTVTRNELVLSDAEVHAFGGRLLGSSVRLRWSDGWSLDGALAARQLDVAKFAAPMLAGGTLEGKGVFSMRASAPERLLANARLEGSFTVQKGSIANIDMTRLLQGSSSSGGTTLFTEMTGGVSADPNRVSVRQIRLAAGLMNGTGQVEMDSKSKLSGRLQIELRSVQARATLAVTGTLKDPQYRRN